MQEVAAPFLSAEPQVALVNSFDRPFDNAVAAARTCYSGRGIVTAEMVGGDEAPDEPAREKARARRDALAEDILKAGHHTVFQHAHFQFALSNVSRQFAWSFLHAHPFYNSEQVSQRYVAVKPGTYTIPPLSGEALSCYEETVQAQFAAYHDLCRALMGPASSAYFERFPARARTRERWGRDIEKKAMEVARYVLPVATFTYLYHTISGLTLLRYHRMCRQFDTPLEQQVVVGKMVERLLAQAPEYSQLLEEPIPLEETPEYAFLQTGGCGGVGVWGYGSVGVRDSRGHEWSSGAPSSPTLPHSHTPTLPHSHTPTPPYPHTPSDFRQEFDAALDGRVSLLLDWKAGNEAVLAQSVREVLGAPRSALSDEEAIRMALDPGRNILLGQALNLTAHGKLTRCLVHAAYTFRKKLSHTADSQDQRHRMTPASRPVLAAHVDGDPDYIVPELVKADDACAALYAQAMERAWQGMARLRALGAPDELTLYLLPNAAAIRFTESADLLSLRHKLAMRLCFNAQEEIWRASLDEAQQIREINPRIGAYLLPPCGLRDLAGQRPICPEGRRFCGLPVWKQDLDEYRRVI